MASCTENKIKVEPTKLDFRFSIFKQSIQLFGADTLSAFMFALRELDILNIKWSPTLWHTTVDKVIVNADGSVVFHFKNGSKVKLT